MQIERVRRPFWTHQVVEYLVGLGLISAAVQLPYPRVPALFGLVIILNAAVAKGGAGAFRLVGTRLHRVLDLVVVVSAVVLAVQPWISIDATGRFLIGGVAFILWFVWFHTDFSDRSTLAERRARRAAEKAARGPVDSTDIGRQAGRVVGGAVVSARRWKDTTFGSSGDAASDAPPPPADATPHWDPPTPPQR
jgi:hypothetical protein